ncbi:hypothetical protein HGRIS_000142 [Hohenbuehelia grisea]|uniref:Aldose 1-epimerase n=1 Tax=Hohenbuehelia grisea TaxID=104357 RepID=A0ABR3JQB5_9AGAR
MFNWRTTLSFTALLAPVLVYSIQPPDWPFDVTSITAPDESITAKFVSLGATMTELWVKDKNGDSRDVIIGYDNETMLLTDPAHPMFNPIVGRYAGRIKNGTFSIPVTKDPQPSGPNVFHTSLNDMNGLDTLHGGTVGWDRRNWTIVQRTRSSVTYKHVDTADEGFPGVVTAYVTHEVSSGGFLKTSVRATATAETPIMITQHVYWNLDAFQDGVSDVLGHQLKVDGSRVIQLDSISVPTGEFVNVASTPFDFRKGKLIGGPDWNNTLNLCGAGCQGFDHCWVYDDSHGGRPKTTLKGQKSGIKLEIFTDQAATQIFTAYWLILLNMPRKRAHGGPALTYPAWAAVALEQQGYADAINNPEWGVNQIYGPKRPYIWSTTYKLSTA